jgi:hypothetical protein
LGGLAVCGVGVIMSDKKAKPTFKRAMIELRRLKRIHDVTVYSYVQTRDHLQEKLLTQEINGNTVLTTQIAGEDKIIARSPFELLSRLSDVYPRVLRESLFVRAISQFEVFLVEAVWEIANRTIEPFKQQKAIEYPQARLLSFENIDELRKDIVQQECRQLTSQGFSYAERYYQSRFGIRLADAPVNLSEIREMHERRHLFVHTGGKIDQRYKNLFAPDAEVGDRVQVSEEYFNRAIETLTKLVEFILASIEAKWPQSEPLRQKIDGELLYAWSNYVAEVKSFLPDLLTESALVFRDRSYLGYWFRTRFSDEDQAQAHLSPDFPYKVGEDVHYLSEILIALKVSDNEAEWIVGGPKSLVGPYVGYQKIMAKRKRFIYFEAQRLDYEPYMVYTR